MAAPDEPVVLYEVDEAVSVDVTVIRPDAENTRNTVLADGIDAA